LWHVIEKKWHFTWVVSSVRRLFAGLPLWRLDLDPMLVHVRFVVTKMARRQIFLREFRSIPVAVSQLMLYTDVDTILIRKASGESLLSDIADRWEKTYFHAVSFSFHRSMC
jgi:hypothetical protein